ncbi:uncharacterized protein LOC131503024 [Neofelis nebulosa]|uniref:uncharacterized protein LOC131503024 n=1 Tax=Neofelis nebulosa TaxID=61452 RepID=UPI00272CD1F2|nr:uncharacterized protein LOC131503024 [Neofelis nebulosa]
MSWSSICRSEPRCLSCHPSRRPPGWLQEEKGAGPGTLRDEMAACGSSVKMQRKQQPVTGLRQAGQQGGAAAERLEPERPSWRQGQWPLWGASTPPPRAHAAVPGLGGPSPEPPPPPPPPALRPPLTGCSGIFSSDAAFKMAAPPPDNPLNRPLQQAPSRRHLVPRPSPPRRYLHSENRPGRPAAFTSRLQPSPPCQASPPRGAPGRPRRRPDAPPPPPGPPGDPPPTSARSRSAPPPPLGAAGLLPGPNCGLLGACSAPRAAPPGLARKGASRAADQAGTRPLRAR